MKMALLLILLVMSFETYAQKVPQRFKIFDSSHNTLNQPEVTIYFKPDQFTYFFESQEKQTKEITPEELDDFINSASWPKDFKASLHHYLHSYDSWRELKFPTLEETIQQSTKFVDDLKNLSVLEYPVCLSECEPNQSVQEGPFHVTIHLDSSKSDHLDFLGKLLSTREGIIYENDNFGLGLSRELGIQRDHPLGGDDRGHTLYVGVHKVQKFEKGTFEMVTYVDGYSRLTPQLNPETGALNSRDEDRRVYQEMLSVDGVEVALTRELTPSTYTKTSFGVQSLEDQEGFAHKLQQMVHSQGGRTQYHYLDQDEATGAVAKLKLAFGKDVVIWKGSKDKELRLKGELQSNLSSGKDSYVGLSAELAYRVGVKDRDLDLPSYLITLETEQQKYLSGERSSKNTLRVEKDVKLSKRVFLHLYTGIRQEDTPLSKEYGVEEWNYNNGRLDFMHLYGASLEIKYH